MLIPNLFFIIIYNIIKQAGAFFQINIFLKVGIFFRVGIPLKIKLTLKAPRKRPAKTVKSKIRKRRQRIRKQNCRNIKIVIINNWQHWRYKRLNVIKSI